MRLLTDAKSYMSYMSYSSYSLVLLSVISVRVSVCGTPVFALTRCAAASWGVR